MKKMDEKPKIDLEGKVPTFADPGSICMQLSQVTEAHCAPAADSRRWQITDAFKVFDSDGSGMITGANQPPQSVIELLCPAPLAVLLLLSARKQPQLPADSSSPQSVAVNKRLAAAC